MKTSVGDTKPCEFAFLMYSESKFAIDPPIRSSGMPVSCDLSMDNSIAFVFSRIL